MVFINNVLETPVNRLFEISKIKPVMIFQNICIIRISETQFFLLKTKICFTKVCESEHRMRSPGCAGKHNLA